MWFKNLVLFRLSGGASPLRHFSIPAFAEFVPCGPMSSSSRGLISPCGDDRLAYSQGQNMLLALCTETKILPPTVISRLAEEKAKALEAEEGRPVGRMQRRRLKEEARAALLPKAFTRRTVNHIWVDMANGWVGIDAPNESQAVDATRILHKIMATQPSRESQAPSESHPETTPDITLPRTKLSPQAAMTDWLISGEAPAAFTVDRDCELRHPLEEKPTVRYTHHPLDGEEIRKHLVAGKLPTRLALTWKDRISFVLTDRLEIKRLAFLDILKEEAETNASNAAEQFDADFALMTGELSRFIPDLVAALGGEAEVG